MVFFLRAATAAFLMFRRAAAFCLVLAMRSICCRRALPASHGSSITEVRP